MIQCVLEDLLVQRQICHKLLELGVLPLKLLQPLGLFGFHLTVLVALSMECQLTHLKILTDPPDRGPSRQHHACIPVATAHWQAEVELASRFVGRVIGMN